MKKLLFFAILIGISIQGYSQVSGSYIDIQDSLYQYLDKSRIATGVLYNRVFPWANITAVKPGDSLYASRTRQAWQELYLAAYDRSHMPSVEEAREIARENEAAGRGISIGYIAFRYNTIDSNALADSALVRGADSLLHDGKPGLNPYISHAIAMPVLFSDALRGDSLRLYFDPRLILNNSGKTIKNIRLKNSDGFEITLTPGSSGMLPTGSSTGGMQYVLESTVSFSDGTLFCCISILTDDGNAVTMNSQTTNTCTSGEDPLEIWTGNNLIFQGYDESTPTQGLGNYKIYYHQQGGNWNHCDKHIRKPVILVDGFDPGDTRHIDPYDDDAGIWELLSYTGSSGAQHLGDELRIKGYDVIVLNFPYYQTVETGAWRDGGADYIERNARVLVRLIQEVNAELATNGSNEKIVILGPSMGGQVARYALAYMEKQQALGKANMNHNTRLFISFDSPHKGANIPISAQQALYHLGNYANEVAAKESYEDQIRSYAARQMLIEQMDGLNKTAPFFIQYYANLNTGGLSGSGGWPLLPRKVALTNGNARGISTNTAGATIMHLEANALGGLINGIDLDLRNMAGTNNAAHTYAGAEKASGFGWGSGILINPSYAIPGMAGQFYTTWSGLFLVIYNHVGSFITTNNNTNGTMDVVQGGTYNTIQQFKDKIAKVLTAGYITQSSIQWSSVKKNHCFIPTVSALAFKHTNFNWGNNLGSNNLVCDNKIPFDNYFTAAANEEHVHISKEAAAWATEEIEYGKPGCPVICATKINGTSAYMCSGTNYTFTLDEAPPAGSSVVWQLSDGLSLISSNSSSVTVRPQSGASGYAPYIQVTIKPQINGVQCGASTTIKNTNIQYGDMFHLVYTEISNPNKYKVTVTPSISGNTYQWAANGINFGDIGPAANKEYDKIPIENQPQYFKVRIYTPSCSGYAMEIQGNHEVLGDFMPPGTGGRPGHNTELSLSPNPTTDSWSLSLPNEWLGSPCSIIITNAVGKIVYNRFSQLPVNDIDTEGWSKGVYYIKVSSHEGRAVIKGVKL